MKKKNKQVMETLIDQCTQAFLAKKPLIMVDTEEVELMERLAWESGIVTLRRKPADISGEEKSYYRSMDVDPDTLGDSVNFFDSAAQLDNLCEEGRSIKSKLLPQLRLVHLVEEDAETRLDLRELRKYVRSYVRCKDDGCPLRSSCILLYGNPEVLPRDLQGYTEILTVEYPRRWEIQEILRRIAEKHEEKLEPLTAKKVAELMIGFSLIQVEEYADRLFRLDNEDGKPLMFCKEAREEILLDAKAQAIRNSGEILTLYRDKKKKKNPSRGSTEREKGNSLGGMQAYKKWVKAAGIHMRNNERYALDLGSMALKGVLLCGVPGCGKSEAAKILYREWGLPMLRMDVDSLMGNLVGDSERNMRQALALVEAMAPCILWIDELEKGFSGAASNDGDGGTFKRMFSRLLTWMQENKKPCFIFATANDISQLPPEFFRSGRFNALFSVFMPTNQECKDIFRVQMEQAEKLRIDTAEEWGHTEMPRPLFDKVCYEEESLQAIMELFTQGKDVKHPEGVKFVSGADIAKITTIAVERLAEQALEEMVPEDKRYGDIEEADWKAAVNKICPINVKTWIKALGEVINDPSLTTQGSGSANLDQIAACYVRLMRGNFASVSLEDQQLFRKDRYGSERADDRINAFYNGKCEMEKPYDQALFNALKERIELIGSLLETKTLNRASD